MAYFQFLNVLQHIMTLDVSVNIEMPDLEPSSTSSPAMGLDDHS